MTIVREGGTMAMVRAPIVAISSFALVGCIEPLAFPCEEDEQCVLDGEMGTCEEAGWCSYPDPSCPSQKRFEAYAPGALASACVELPPDPECIAFDAVAAGPEHTCARDLDGYLWCWGANAYGQVTLPPSEYVTGPTRLDALGPGVLAFTLADHGCALQVDGLRCWGSNDHGQVDWTTAETARPPTRVDLPAGIVNTFATGARASCASIDDALYCWGQLPQGDDRPPTRIAGLSEPLALAAAGTVHACGVGAVSGDTYCMGNDDRGQLGNGMPTGELTVIVQFATAGSISAMAAGDAHTCTIFTAEATDTASVLCWGANEAGQVQVTGGETVAMPSAAVADLIGRDFVALAAGRAHSCVADDEGVVQCWGENAYGQRNPNGGVEGAGPDMVVVDPEGTARVVSLAAGDRHTCAALDDGSVRCWGCNDRGQLGAAATPCDGTPTMHTVCITP